MYEQKVANLTSAPDRRQQNSQSLGDQVEYYDGYNI